MDIHASGPDKRPVMVRPDSRIPRHRSDQSRHQLMHLALPPPPFNLPLQITHAHATAG